jgi:hypothetical protein
MFNASRSRAWVWEEDEEMVQHMQSERSELPREHHHIARTEHVRANAEGQRISHLFILSSAIVKFTRHASVARSVSNDGNASGSRGHCPRASARTLARAKSFMCADNVKGDAGEARRRYDFRGAGIFTHVLTRVVDLRDHVLIVFFTLCCE